MEVAKEWDISLPSHVRGGFILDHIKSIQDELDYLMSFIGMIISVLKKAVDPANIQSCDDFRIVSQTCACIIPAILEYWLHPIGWRLSFSRTSTKTICGNGFPHKEWQGDEVPDYRTLPIKISLSWKMWSDSSHFKCFKHCTVIIGVVSCIAITLARMILTSNPNFAQDLVENYTCTVPIIRLFWEMEVGKMSMSRNTGKHFNYPEVRSIAQVWEQGASLAMIILFLSLLFNDKRL